MSGHSKWANIKHRKGRQDAAKGKIFTKLGREILVAAKAGGSNPETNFRLKIAIQKAKEENLPNENILRAIQKGAGGQDGNAFEELTYEGYGPGGVAIMAAALTDNRNRTAGEIRHLFSKYGGNLGETGCVSWMFKEKGIIMVDSDGLDIDEDGLILAALEAGAEDIERQTDGTYEITVGPENFENLKSVLQNTGINITDAEITMIPDTISEVMEIDLARQLLRLMELLEEHDDVQNTYTNLEISEELIEQIK